MSATHACCVCHANTTRPNMCGECSRAFDIAAPQTELAVIEWAAKRAYQAGLARAEEIARAAGKVNVSGAGVFENSLREAARQTSRYIADAIAAAQSAQPRSEPEAPRMVSCVCPFPRETCPRYTHQCAVCWADASREPEAPRDEGACSTCAGTGRYVRPSPSTTFGPAVNCGDCRGTGRRPTPTDKPGKP